MSVANAISDTSVGKAERRPYLRSMRDRVFSRLIIDPSGCLLWTGALVKGYGVTNENGKPRYVHRVMYEWFTGPIPDGMEIDHLCRVKHCAAPAHLEAVTHAENLRRGPVRQLVPKTACPHGHPYDEANTYWQNGSKVCRQCRRDQAKRPAVRSDSWQTIIAAVRRETARRRTAS